MEFTNNGIKLTREEANNLSKVLYLGSVYMSGSYQSIRDRWKEMESVYEVLDGDKSNSDELIIPSDRVTLLAKFGKIAVEEHDRTLDDFCRDAVGDYIGHCVPGLEDRGVEALANARAIVERYGQEI